MQQLVEIGNKIEYVTEVEVDHSFFFNYVKFFDCIYNKFQSGCVSKYQIFLYSMAYGDDAPIRCQTSNLPYAEGDIDINLRKTATNDERIIVINGVHNNRIKVVKSLQLEQLYTKAPSMNPQKEVELFTK